MTAYGATIDPTQLPDGVLTAEIIATDASSNANQTIDAFGNLNIQTSSTQAFVVFIPPAPTTEIFVRDAAYRRVALLDGWSNLTYIIRHHAVGAFTVDVEPYNSDGTRSEAAQLLLSYGAGIIVVRDGTVVFSGPANYQKRARDNTGKQLIEVSGFDDMVWLARRQIKQEPSNPSPPYNSNAYDTETNPASTVMRHYVGANLGSGATTERQLAALALATDPAIGGTATWDGRLGSQLLAVLATLARPANLGFRITQDLNSNTLTFAVTPTTDRSMSVVFADTLGNVTDWTREETSADENYEYVGGAGAGTSRTYVEVRDSVSESKWGRAEAFTDQRTQTSTAALTTAGQAQLLQAGDKLAVSFTVVQTGGHAWPTDWGLGDKVTAIVDREFINDLVREIRVDLTPDGETITPTVGTAGASNSSLASQEAKQFRKRVSVLEGV